MGFVKVQKNKAYYKRLQVKYRRRFSGKTDYHARRKMVAQEKNKYNTPKYRLIVRITNKKIITQVAWATIQGDRMLSQATSAELENFGVPAGHTNYSACYATGLLIARRTLQALKLDDAIKGVEECDAKEYHVEEEEHERRPFKVILDVGLIRTIPGSRVFGVLKGAVDGGLYVPHSVKNFPGYKEPEERGEDYEYDEAAHLERIMGNHVVDFMKDLEEEDPERYKVAFARFIAADKGPDDIEDMYRECHAKIRENPKFVKKEHSGITNKRQGNKITTSNGTSYTRCIKCSKAQRMDRVKQKIQAAGKRLLAAAEADDDDDE